MSRYKCDFCKTNHEYSTMAHLCTECTETFTKRLQTTSEADVRLNLLLDAMAGEIKAGLTLARSEMAVENLAGNMVKREFWQGEIAAYERVKNVLVASSI